MKRPRIIRSQPKELNTIPEKLSEFEPFHDPVNPQIYPDESPVENPKREPNEIPPYILPKPNEFPLK